MKTNNRPMVKRIEYEVDCIREIIWTENKDIAYNSLTKSLTGNTREVERPMNDTEYIEYLEKENQDLKSKISIEKFSQKTFNEFYGIDKEYQQQFIKVVESVLVDGGHSFWDITYNGQFKDLCDCGKWNSNMKITYEQHLLQEIKSAIEKENHEC